MVKASLIIPTYQRPEETRECLNLILKSENYNIKFLLEIIIIDSSPDNRTLNILKEIRNNHNFVYIHRKKQTLPGDARNIGVKKAKHELIISIDSDIAVQPNTIWSMIEYMQKHNRVARMTGKSIFTSGDNKGEIDRPSNWDRIYEKYDSKFIEGVYGRYEAFYKTPFLKLGGYDNIFKFCGEGTDLSVRYWRAGYPLGYNSETTAFHNNNAASSVRRAIKDKMTQMYRSLFLVSYKYDVGDPELSNNFINSHQERKAAYGDKTEFYSIVSAAESIEWFKNNAKEILKSKKRIPKKYDFKPFDVFSNLNLLNECLNDAKNVLSSSYKKVFLD